jgi:hypothetical protein
MAAKEKDEVIAEETIPFETTVEVPFDDSDRIEIPEGKGVKEFNAFTGEWESVHYSSDTAKSHKASVGDE